MFDFSSRRRCLLVCAVFLQQIVFSYTFSVGRTLGQDNWPRFHGVNGNGLAPDAKLPATWQESDYAWKIELPGVGSGSPVVWGDRIFLSLSDPNTAQLTVLCVSADDGSELWKRTFESVKYKIHIKNTFASSTMAVDSANVYVTFANQDHTWLVALSHQGVERWKRDFGTYVSTHGFGNSPLVHRDKVILVNSQQAIQLPAGKEPGASSVIAVSTEDGREIWKTALETRRVCYGVPCVHRRSDGTEELVGANMGNGFYCLDLNDGAFKWQTKNSFNKRVVSSPLIADDVLIATAGSGGGGNYLVAMKLNAKSGEAPEEVFRIQSACYVPSPIVVDGMIFMFTDKGVVSCHDLESGGLIWKKRVSSGFNGSPVAAAENLYAVDEKGNVHVVAISKEPKLSIAASMGSPSRSTPAIVGNRIYFRSYNSLWALDGSRLSLDDQ